MATSGTQNSSSSYRFIYCETSNPNYPSVSFGIIMRSNSCPSGKTVTCGFWYYMYGGNVGVLEVTGGVSSHINAYTYRAGTTLTGQQQGNRTSAWIKKTFSYSNPTTTQQYISFFYTSGSTIYTYQADICIDSINMTYA
jgi:hypothetical protein